MRETERLSSSANSFTCSNTSVRMENATVVVSGFFLFFIPLERIAYYLIIVNSIL